MTESEFEEFIITLGMKYYKQNSTAYGNMEGFRVILRFLEREERYVLLIGAGTSQEEQKLNALLRRLATQKNRIINAQFDDCTIQVGMKMTINSDVDRQTIKDGISMVLSFCRDLKILPYCKYCGEEKKTEFYTVGGELDAMCEDCFEQKRSIADKKMQRHNKKQRFIRGLLGSTAGIILGVLVYIVMYQFGIRWGLGGAVIVLGALFGFALLGKRHNKKSIFTCMALSWIFLIGSEYVSYVTEFAVELSSSRTDIFWAVGEAVSWLNIHILSPNVYQNMLINLGIGTFLILLFGSLFAMIYKATNKPYIKSEKIE